MDRKNSPVGRVACARLLGIRFRSKAIDDKSERRRWIARSKAAGFPVNKFDQMLEHAGGNVAGLVSNRRRMRSFYGRVHDSWLWMAWVVRAAVGSDNYGEWAVDPRTEDESRAMRRFEKMAEIQTQIENRKIARTAPNVFIAGGCRRGKKYPRIRMNDGYVAANYIHWMTKYMHQSLSNESMFAAEPPKIPGAVWAIWRLRQKMVQFWSHRIAEDRLHSFKLHNSPPNDDVRPTRPGASEGDNLSE